MSPQNFKASIRKASRKHLYSVTVMTRKFFPYTGFTFDTVVERMGNEDIEYYVALVDGHCVGFVDVEFKKEKNKKEKEKNKKEKQAKILGLAVLPEFRRRGIGTRLLNKALAISRKRGAKKAVILVAKDNISAQRVYARKGFRITGKLGRKLWNKTVLLMTKKL